ncbi:MAG TPA: sulfite exporter TauE/SafE family protein [Kofleriaceae bacterium]|nr:sulfite exporter TauE/SafE family protein [Kofleriaceae bacterium]
MSDLARFELAAGAALAAGAVNAIAGGGSLITFPVLVATGLPAVVANVTNTVALTPGFVGATLAQRRDLVGQGRRIAWMLPVAAAAGVVGGLLLLNTGEAAFKAIVPYLILLAAAALVAQGRLREWVVARSGGEHSQGWAIALVALASVYGGYFGAAMGVMLLAALAIIIGDSLTRLNALKQTISLTVNVAAAVLFATTAQVDWPIAGVMFAASLAGGALGGAVASRIPPAVLRWVIVVLAVIVASIYLLRGGA